MGLTTAKMIVSELGGSINFDSIYQKGSRFTVILPVEINDFDNDKSVSSDNNYEE